MGVFQVVVVTGASAGIGRAAALAFARRGAHVALVSRNLDRLRSLQEEIEALGGKALALGVDVSSAQALEEAADTIERELGPIDVWVSNAMVSVFSPVAAMTADEYRRVTEVTYLGAVYGTLSALQRMRARGRGCIVLVGSALAYRGIPLQSAYCAAKHALKGFNDSIQAELRHEGSKVRVTMVQLSAFNTPQFDWVRSRLPRQARPMGTPFQPELAADAIVWAARHGKREVIVGFPAWYAIWGSKLFPGLVDRYLARTAYDGQQTGEAHDAHAPDNLMASVPGAYGAHGRFDAEARSNSLQFRLVRHARLAWAAAAVLAALVVLARKWP